MKLAYIAGPFRAQNAWQRAQNIREAEQVGMAVATELGVQPVIPHSNTGNFDGTLEDAFWLDGTKEMMRRCDMVVCTDRWHVSTGAKDEVKEAHRLNIPAYVKIGACYYPILHDGFPALGQRLDPWELRAIIKADWKREITIDPSTNSISATLAACSAPVPEIVRVHPSGAGDHGIIDVTTGDGLTRYAVQQVLGKSLRNVTAEELAKLGLRPSQPEPGVYDLTDRNGNTVIETKITVERASQPEPPPTGNGDLVTPPLLAALADYPELAALVSARDAFGRAKYGTGLRTHNGRNPIEDGRQEIGDLLQYLQQAVMEGKDIGPLLKLCRNGLEVFKKNCDTCFGSGWQVNNHAPRLRCECGVEPWVESDPEPPTLYLRSFVWESCAPVGAVASFSQLFALLDLVPNALYAKELAHPTNAEAPPHFGFDAEHTGPRTLREYLEAP